MRHPPQIGTILQTGGFTLHHELGRIFKISFAWQCVAIAAISAGAILSAGILDRALILPGRNIGLLQHPGIWAFIALQVALPLALKGTLNKLVSAHKKLKEIADIEGTAEELLVAPLHRFLQIRDSYSRSTATILYLCGLTAFVWNTYQNQLPGVVVPYDFWDSKNHLWGFWITRVYKLYLFVWLLPYIASVQIGVMVIVLSLIRRARLCGKLRLLLFHPDGLGGFGFIPGLVTMPILTAALLASIPTAGAFEVHRAVAITPLMGLFLILAATMVACIVPIVFLRTDIVAIKAEMLQKLRALQQIYYSKMIGSDDIDFDSLKQSNEALDYFEKMCARVMGISNYPHLSRMLGYSSVVLTPSVISLMFKVYEDLAPVVNPLLKKH